MKKLILFCLFWVVGISATTENVTERLLSSRLTLQLGFEFPFLVTPGLALKPIFSNFSSSFLARCLLAAGFLKSDSV